MLQSHKAVNFHCENLILSYTDKRKAPLAKPLEQHDFTRSTFDLWSCDLWMKTSSLLLASQTRPKQTETEAFNAKKNEPNAIQHTHDWRCNSLCWWSHSSSCPFGCTVDRCPFCFRWTGWPEWFCPEQGSVNCSSSHHQCISANDKQIDSSVCVLQSKLFVCL